MDLPELSVLRREVETCQKCMLHSADIYPIFGEGSSLARIMFIGEAPGYWENRKKRPFVGKSGKILDEYLNKIELRRKDVFITNIVKCRPPDNRDPHLDEIGACSPYLKSQLELINPKIVVTLGRFAARYFLNDFSSMTEIVGRPVQSGSFLLFPIYHPATCLYQSTRYRPLFEQHFSSLRSILDNFSS